MIKVNYDFYVEKYHGDMISEDALERMSIKANSYLNNLMHQSPDNENIELVQLCLCEAAELIYQDEVSRRKHDGKNVLSESNDGYSVSYGTNNNELIRGKVYEVIRRYLSNTGLLYAGVRCR